MSEETVEDLLLACHDKIRRFLTAATRLASDEPAPADDVAATAKALVRYFTEALPRHSEDEDASLHPRLRAAGLAADLDALSREHEAMDAVLARLVPAWRAVAAGTAARTSLAGDTAELVALFERHLAVEERDVIPQLRPVLGDATMREVADEMRGRRER